MGVVHHVATHGRRHGRRGLVKKPMCMHSVLACTLALTLDSPKNGSRASQRSYKLVANGVRTSVVCWVPIYEYLSIVMSHASLGHAKLDATSLSWAPTTTITHMQFYYSVYVCVFFGRNFESKISIRCLELV